MFDLVSLRSIFSYSDWANSRLLDAAAGLRDAQLDQPFPIGPGSLRRTLIHICVGENVWLKRWQGQRETRWPSEDVKLSVQDVRRELEGANRERERFMSGLSATRLQEPLVYRDSKGSLFRAPLGQMMFQAANHSIHHRAQAVNLLRQLGAGLVELDYMMWVRQPVQA